MRLGGWWPVRGARPAGGRQRLSVLLGDRLFVHARGAAVSGAVAVADAIWCSITIARCSPSGTSGCRSATPSSWPATTTLFCVSSARSAPTRSPGSSSGARRCCSALILAVGMFPQISVVSPLYLLLRELHLINTYPGLVLPYLTFAMPLTVWLLVGFFRQLPGELEEAAMVDGAGRLRAFWEVIVPLAVPGIATTAILTFVYSWNEFLFALSFTLGPERQTVPVAIALFRGQYQVPWGQILAAAVVATAPVTLLVLAFQRRIVQGLTAGAVKG